MKRIVPCSLAFCTLLALNLLGAPNPASLFTEANANYQKGDFATAERRYRELLSAGADSGSIYYNLGNACFKQKRLGEAIYYWEKARRKLPGDTDIQENLQLARLLMVDRIDVAPDPLPVRVLDYLVHLMTVAQESWIALVLFALANVLFGLYLLARRPRSAFSALMGSLAAAALMLLIGSSLAWKLYEQSYRKEGIIVEQKVDVRSGPSLEYVIVFTVHEGTMVRIRGTAGEWHQVSLPNGWSGWMQNYSLRIL